MSGRYGETQSDGAATGLMQCGRTNMQGHRAHVCVSAVDLQACDRGLLRLEAHAQRAGAGQDQCSQRSAAGAAGRPAGGERAAAA